MPHTSRRKNKRFEHPKRWELADDDGWTRVVTSTARNLAKLNLAAPSSHEPDHEVSQQRVRITKTEVPQGVTVKTLMTRFTKLQQQWLASASYEALVSAIAAQQQGQKNITQCILLGSGTFCGYSAGWIGRHDVALLQAAVFQSIAEAIRSVQGALPRCYAQEPLYNGLDRDLLRELNVDVLEDPAGLEKISDTTFVYAPGAERNIAKSVYRNNAAMMLSNHATIYLLALNNGTTHSGTVEMRDIVQDYLKSHDSVRLPDFDMANEPFYLQYLHYPKPSERQEDEETTGGT